jgi:hypothetical protein
MTTAKKPFVDKEKALFHVKLGAAYLALWVFGDFVNRPDMFLNRVVNNVWLISYLTVLNYLLFEHALPLIKLNWKRIILGILILWSFLMMYSFGTYAWRAIGIGIGLYTPLRPTTTIVEGVGYHMPYNVASIFFFGIIRHVYLYRKLREAAQKLRLEKQEAELNYLKSQTNPHFLFNTLNNIYALARAKSDLAPESILRLSKILRFMLYETSGAYISVEQELKIISDYIALEQLRYDDTLRINYNYDIEDGKQALPPLLLIPLVENAFKHGVSETRGYPFVDIHLSIKNRQLVFNVKNSTDNQPGEGPVKENIGLSNLRRQLELLYTEYGLSVQQGDGQFTATLKINLASHV